MNRLWNSPTFFSWISILSRTLSFALALPLILSRFTTEEIALWYLFATLMGLQLIIDMGFSATFSRVLAFAMGGSTDIEFNGASKIKTGNGVPNVEMVNRVYSTMNWVYLRLAIVWFIFLTILGWWSSIVLIEQMNEPATGWVALYAVVVGSSIRLYGAKYASYLLGVDKVALLRRWESAVWIATLIVSILTLLSGGGFLLLVVVTQSFIVINVVINKYLVLIVGNRQVQFIVSKQVDRHLLSQIWSRVWRSGVGIAISAGLVQGMGIVYARIAPPDLAAPYLLALNIMRILVQFSQAPFYTKIPKLSRLYSEGKLQAQIKIARKGMRLSYWVLVLGVLFVALVIDFISSVVKYSVDFVDYQLWVLMGVAMYAERYGAMHLQLYSTTNHIIWHVANGVTGAIFILLVIPLYYFYEVYAFPISQIFSNLIFYDWYCARKSYKAFNIRPIKFEFDISFVPLIFYLCVCLAAYKLFLF